MAFRAAKHDRHSSDCNVSPQYYPLATYVFKIDIYWRSVCHVPQTTFVRRDFIVGSSVIVIKALGRSDVDVCVPKASRQNSLSCLFRSQYELKKEHTIYIAGNSAVCFDDFLDFVLDKEIERVDMLFDQALDFQECR